MTEAQLVTAVLELAASHKVLAHHCRDSRHCQGPRGFPDLVLAGPGGVIFAECKSQDGETSAAQDLWLHMIDDAGGLFADWRIWRPADLATGVIERELVRLAEAP